MILDVFGPEASWPTGDLIGYTTEISADLTLAAYCSGAFPMPWPDSDVGDVIGWWSPVQRGVLPLDRLRVTTSLRKMMKRYRTTVDQAFDEVLRRCADPERPFGWIDDDIISIYTFLHRQGVVHSVETWDADGRLVGGLYGVSLGGLFAGESMFHDAEFGRDASKVALVRLVEVLSADGQVPASLGLLDVQWRTPHLGTLGVIEMPRRHYLHRLSRALDQPGTDWNAAARLPAQVAHEVSWDAAIADPAGGLLIPSAGLTGPNDRS